MICTLQSNNFCTVHFTECLFYQKHWLGYSAIQLVDVLFCKVLKLIIYFSLTIDPEEMRRAQEEMRSQGVPSLANLLPGAARSSQGAKFDCCNQELEKLLNIKVPMVLSVGAQLHTQQIYYNNTFCLKFCDWFKGFTFMARIELLCKIQLCLCFDYNNHQFYFILFL